MGGPSQDVVRYLNAISWNLLVGGSLLFSTGHGRTRMPNGRNVLPREALQ
jgi:hypothetical protein